MPIMDIEIAMMAYFVAESEIKKPTMIGNATVTAEPMPPTVRP